MTERTWRFKPSTIQGPPATDEQQAEVLRKLIIKTERMLRIYRAKLKEYEDRIETRIKTQ